MVVVVVMVLEEALRTMPLRLVDIGRGLKALVDMLETICVLLPTQKRQSNGIASGSAKRSLVTGDLCSWWTVAARKAHV